jgi:hypothetical protein
MGALTSMAALAVVVHNFHWHRVALVCEVASEIRSIRDAQAQFVGHELSGSLICQQDAA